MSDYRDLPLHIARRAAERNRESERLRERWRTPLRVIAWLSGVAAIAVLTVLAQPLWQPYVGGRQAEEQRLQAGAHPLAAREDETLPQGRAAVTDSDGAARALAQAPSAAASPPRATTAKADATDPAPPRVVPAPVQAPTARAATQAEPSAIAADGEAGDAPKAGATESAQAAEETEALRSRTDEDLRRGRLPQAADGYRALLERSADDNAAEEGLAKVAAAHAARAQRLAADFDFDQAEQELATARDLDPDAASIREAVDDLARARAARARLPSSIDTARQTRVRSLLDEAANALARGDLMDPPGESAFDKIAAARALAPDAAEVRIAAYRLERARQTQGDRPATPR
jgi:hypothetical protein